MATRVATETRGNVALEARPREPFLADCSRMGAWLDSCVMATRADRVCWHSHSTAQRRLSSCLALALRLPCLVSCHRAGLAKSTRLAFVVCKYVSEVCSLQVPLRSTKSFGRWPGSGLQHTGGGLFAESAAGLAPGSWRGRARAWVSRFGSEVRLYEPCVCVCPAPGAYPGLGPLAVGRCF
jgi:hypothetical protein